MFTIRKLFKFEAAHKLAAAKSACCVDTIHGHSYKVEVFFRAEKLNKDGMVVDFGLINNMVKPVIEAWDHALFICRPNDLEEWKRLDQTNKKLIGWNASPTAEFMAKVLYCMIDSELGDNKAKLWKVRVHETETGWAEFEGEGARHDTQDP